MNPLPLPVELPIGALVGVKITRPELHSILGVTQSLGLSHSELSG